MPNNKFEAVITIKKIGEKDNKFWIQDENGDYYSGFKSYQGTENIEYSELCRGNHGERFKEGDRASIQFVKKVGNDDKIYRNLKHIFPAEAAQVAKPAEKPRTGQNLKPSEVDWDRLGYEKTCIAVAAAMMSKGETWGTVLDAIQNDIVWNIWEAAKKSGRKHFETGNRIKVNSPEVQEALDQDVPPMMNDVPESFDEVPF
jgi:hypothetical protein